ncbi:Tn3 family transposase [Streptomyces sp. NPDC002125]
MGDVVAVYSDIVFGLFAICGYQFSPRIADISDARLWRTNTAAGYGPLQPVSNHERRADLHQGLLELACSIICLRRLRTSS